MENTIENSAPKISVNIAARLDSAQSANIELQKEVVPENDRIIIARNLGYLFQKCQAKSPSLSLRQVFIETFGIASGESAFKKRNRLVILPKDTVVSEKLARKGRQYRSLAITLSRYIELPENAKKSDAEIISILRIIEGSSYDQSTSHSDRFNHEYKIEITSKLRRLTDKVVDQVDVDWMRIWSDLHTVPIIGTTGMIDSISDQPIMSRGPQASRSVSNLNLDGQVNNCLSPCVNIGTLIAKRQISSYFDIEISEDTPEGETLMEIIKAVATKIGADLNFDDYTDTDDFDLLDALSNFDFDTLDDEDITLGDSYETHRRIDLELRYDSSSDRWNPCILMRFPISTGNYNADFASCIPDAEIITFHPDIGILLAAKYISPGSYRVFTINQYMYPYLKAEERASFSETFGTRDSKSWANGPFRGIVDNDGVHPFDERYDRFLLQSDVDDDKSWKFESNITPHVNPLFSGQSYFVKAPKKSIASYILLNLAYASEEERIDNLIIDDAKRKHEMLKNYSVRVSKEYDEAISKF